MKKVAESVSNQDIILVRKNVGHASPNKKTSYVSLEMKSHNQTFSLPRLRFMEQRINLLNMHTNMSNLFDQVI